MKRLMLTIGLAVAWSTSGVSQAAQATPDPTARVLRGDADGWERGPRFRNGPVVRREAGKRCRTCSVTGRIDRVPAPGRGSDPSIPEPSAALLFGAGALAIRSFVRAPSDR
jgi:hypothetical protein